MKNRIILASQSPRRKYILGLIGFKPIVKVSNCDESKIKEKDPEKLVKLLSALKAQDVAKDCKEGDIIVAADTVVSVDDKILGKPKSEKEADKMLKTIKNRKHIVYTGVTIIKKGDSAATGKSGKKPSKDIIKTFCEKSIVTVADLTQAEIDEYIASREPMDKAGAYGVQGLFGRHIPKVQGDFFNVMGLPAHKTYEAIKQMLKEG